MGERIEALLRIPLGLFYSIILAVLNLIAGVVWIALFIYTLILGRRHTGMARFMNGYISFMYRVYRYIMFTTNDRPELSLKPIELCDFEEDYT